MKKAIFAVLLLLSVILSVNANAAYNETAPTLEFSGVAGDYSAYLTWSANGNGSDIEKYEIQYSLTAVPDVVISTVTLPPSASAITSRSLISPISRSIR